MRSSNFLRGAVTAVLLVAVASADRVVVRPDVMVGSDPVRLTDVASLEGPLAEALAQAVVAPAPMPGESRHLDGATVLASLQAQGLDPATVTYRIPATLRLRRRAQVVAPEAVREAVRAHVMHTLGPAAPSATVRSVDVTTPLRIPDGLYDLTVVGPPTARLVGRERLEVEARIDGHAVGRTWVTADVARTGSVVVAAHPLEPGQIVDASDLQLDTRDLSQLPRGVATEPHELVGSVVRAPIEALATIRRDQVAPAAAVKRGDVVQLVARQGGLEITAPGEVRDEAVQGGRVRVTNRVTGKEIVGRVLDPKTVEVVF